MAKKKYYVVFIGRKPGIYNEWFGANGAEIQINGFSGARYQGFATLSDAKQAFNQFRKTNHVQRQKKTSPITERQIQEPVPGRTKITMYTDGGCIYNPGPGGYGVVLIKGKQKKEYSGSYRLTTNNRMELMACIIGLKKIKTASSVVLYSDSKYVVNGITKGWAKRWQANNWMRNKTDRAENVDLWEQLLDLCQKHSVQFKWVKGHAGHPENERCDKLANNAARRKNSPADIAYEKGKANSAI